MTQGLIFYQHSGEEIFEDSFEVTLADAHVPPNLSPAYVSPGAALEKGGERLSGDFRAG